MNRTVLIVAALALLAGCGRRQVPAVGPLREITVASNRWGAVESVVRATLQRRVRALGRQMRSLHAGQGGRLEIRLSVDARGRVTHIAFVSGALMLPSVKVELVRLLRRWRFGTLSAPSKILFTLQIDAR